MLSKNYSLSAAFKRGDRKGQKVLLGFITTDQRTAAISEAERRALVHPEIGQEEVWIRVNEVMPKSDRTRANGWRD